MAIEVIMPRLTDTMHEGIISYWYCQEGDSITEGELLFVVETDKASVEVEACASGQLLKIVTPAGETADVGSQVAIIGDEGENITALLKAEASSPEPADQKSIQDPKGKEKQKRPVSPAARRKAKAANIDLNLITGTGTGGMITEKDLNRHLQQHNDIQPKGNFEETDQRVLLKGVARAMAERMALTTDIPQVTTVAEVNATQLKILSKQTKMTITSFAVWAIAQALKDFPIINSSFDEDSIILKKQYNIGISVATPNGLLVPNIKHVEQKNICIISSELSELVRKGRDNQLSIEDLSGGTFTVTNSGVFGSLLFTPRINPPEGAILGMGKIMEQPIVVDGRITIGSMMYLSLSYDHRIIDGENAVKFLQNIKRYLEMPGQAFEPQ